MSGPAAAQGVAYDAAPNLSEAAAVVRRGEHVLTIGSPAFRTSLLEVFADLPLEGEYGLTWCAAAAAVFDNVRAGADLLPTLVFGTMFKDTAYDRWLSTAVELLAESGGPWALPLAAQKLSDALAAS